MSPSRPRPQRQRGVAALVVVLVLFFVVSLVAAYTSRNLIFEQRTGINQFRSTQALEAAEAGLEWAVGMLNSGRVDTACRPGTKADSSFRARYLGLAPTTGLITATGSGAGGLPPQPTCVLDGENWTCSCPLTTTTSPAVPTTPGPHPAFRLGFSATTQPGVVRIVVVGCTVLDEGCLTLTSGASGLVAQAVAPGNEGTAAVSALLALTGNLPAIERDAGTSEVLATLPRDAVVAQGNVEKAGTGTLTVTRVGSGPGFALRAGGTLPAAGIEPFGPPGTPGSRMLQPADLALQDLDKTAGLPAGERMFASLFNVRPKTFETQPAIVRLDCPTACRGSQLETRINENPGLPVWVAGDLDLDTNVELGSVQSPALIVVTGDVDFSAANATVNGLLYGRAETWTISGTPKIRGALVAENDLRLDVAGGNVSHDADVLRRLNTLSGSFVRVPGGWKDFP